MASSRRWYLYLVSAISLQVVVWALISLLRNTFTPQFAGGVPLTVITANIAVVAVGLPLYLLHWLWAQRLAAHSAEEREAPLRAFYLYGMQAFFLAPILANAFDLLAGLLYLPFAAAWRGSALPNRANTPLDAILHALFALVVLFVFLLYHQRVLAEDARGEKLPAGTLTARRLFNLGFSAAGLTLTALGAIHLLRWLFFQFGPQSRHAIQSMPTVSDEIARLLIGLPLWLLSWRAAQLLFPEPVAEEREPSLRKVYLYGVSLYSIVVAATNLTILLAGGLRRLLSLSPQTDARFPLPVLLVLAVLWAYHIRLLRVDARRPDLPGIRRLYWYLLAAIGLAASLIGLGGVLSTGIRALGEQAQSTALRDNLAWFTAALIAGLPLWLLPWRRVQLPAEAPGPIGEVERWSLTRKTYLYFYLFVAALTLLTCLIFIVRRLLNLALGVPRTGNLLGELAHALAFSGIAAAVWFYHSRILRRDQQLAAGEQATVLARMRAVVVDTGDGRFGQAVLEALRREFPDLPLLPIGLTPQAAAALGVSPADPESYAALLREATLLVGPWQIAVPGEMVPPAFAAAIAASAAHKVLIPVPASGWEWVGVVSEQPELLARQVVTVVRQVLWGKVEKPRALSPGALIGLGILAVWVFLSLVIPLFYNAMTGVD